MVNEEILSAQQQASQQLQDIQAQRGQISAAQQQIAEFNPNIRLTAQQQAGQTLESMYALRQAEATRGAEKAQQLQAVNTVSQQFESQAQPAEKSIREFQEQIQRQIERDRDQERYSNSDEGIAENKARVENKLKYQEYVKTNFGGDYAKAREAYNVQLSNLKEAGLTPQYDKLGGLTYYDATKGFSYSADLLPTQRAADVDKLVELGILNKMEIKQTTIPLEINLASEAARVRGELANIVGIQPAAQTVKDNLIVIPQRQTIGAGEIKLTPPEPVRLGNIISAPFEIVKLGLQATSEAALGTAGKIQTAMFGELLPGKGIIAEGGLIYIKPTNTAIPTVELPSAISGVKDAQQQFIGKFGSGEGYKTITPEQIGDVGKTATEFYVAGTIFKGIKYLPSIFQLGLATTGGLIAAPALRELADIKTDTDMTGEVTPEIQQKRLALGMQFVAGTALALGSISNLLRTAKPVARFLTQQELNKLPKKTDIEIYGVSSDKQARTTIDIVRGEFPGAYLKKASIAEGNRGYVIKIPSNIDKPFTLQLTEKAKLISRQGVSSNVFGEVVKTDTGISGVRVYSGELLNPNKKLIENIIGESIEKGSGDKTYLLTKISRTATNIEGNIFQRTFKKPETQTSTYIEQITSKKAYAYASDIYKGIKPAYTPLVATKIEIATPSMQFDKTVNFPKRATIIESSNIAKIVNSGSIKGIDVKDILPKLERNKLILTEQGYNEKQLSSLFSRTPQVTAKGESTLIYAPDLSNIKITQKTTPLKSSIDISVTELSGAATKDRKFIGRSFEYADIKTESVAPIVSDVSYTPKKTIASIYAIEAKEKEKALTSFITKQLPKEIDKTITTTTKSIPSTSIFYGKGAATEIEQTINKLSLNKEFILAASSYKNQLNIIPSITPSLILRTGALTPLAAATFNIGAFAVIPLVTARENNILKDAQEQNQNIKQVQQPVEITVNKYESKQIQLPQFKQIQLQELIQNQQQKFSQVNIQEFKQTQLQQQQQQISRNISYISSPPSAPPFIFNIKTRDNVKNLLSSKRKVKGYQAQVKRGGVFVNVGKTTTMSKALETGSKATLSSIAATFRVVKTNRDVEIDDSNDFKVNMGVFRTPKNKAPLTFIQRKGGTEGGVGRLSTYQELQDIKSSKRAATIQRNLGYTINSQPFSKPAKKSKPILKYGGSRIL